MRVAATILVFLLATMARSQDQDSKTSLNSVATELLGKYLSLPAIPIFDSTSVNSLLANCTVAQIKELLNRQEAPIRYLSFSALVNLDTESCFTWLIEKLDDTTRVKYSLADGTASAYLIDLLLIKAKDRLSASQKDSLVEQVISRQPALQEAVWMLESLPVQERFYSHVRHMACSEWNSCNQLRILYTLARYKKHEDVPYIYYLLTKNTDACSFLRYRIIENFPNNIFLPLLDSLVLIDGNPCLPDPYYCRALAAFQSPESQKRLDSLVNTIMSCDKKLRAAYLEPVFLAIARHYSPLYEKLYQRMLPLMIKSSFKKMNEPDHYPGTHW